MARLSGLGQYWDSKQTFAHALILSRKVFKARNVKSSVSSLTERLTALLND